MPPIEYSEGTALDAIAVPAPDALVVRVHRAYLDWLDTQRLAFAGWRPEGSLMQLPVLRTRRAPGNTCLSALQSGVCGTIEKPINNSKGCGGVMRVAPIGLFLALTPGEAFDRATRAEHEKGWITAETLRRVEDNCIRHAAKMQART